MKQLLRKGLVNGVAKSFTMLSDWRPALQSKDGLQFGRLLLILVFCFDCSAMALAQRGKKIGLRSWNTAVAYDYVKVTDATGKVIIEDDFNTDTGQWELSGGFMIKNGSLMRENDKLEGGMCLCKIPVGDNYTIQVKARKQSGKEGFIVVYDAYNYWNYSSMNLGGWDNTKFAYECCNYGKRATGASMRGSIEKLIEYNIRVDVRNGKADCYLNGNSILSNVSNLQTYKDEPIVVTQPKDPAKANAALAEAERVKVRGDDKTAFKNYMKAAKLNHALACHKVGEAFYYGRGTAKDYAKSFQWNKKSAELGNADGMCSLGVLYDSGEGGVRDYSAACYWYQCAIEADNNSYAYYHLAENYYSGEGVDKDLSESARLWMMAAEYAYKNSNEYVLKWVVESKRIPKGYPDAIFARDLVNYAFGTSGVPFEASFKSRHPKAVPYLLKMAEQGNAKANQLVAGYQWSGEMPGIAQDKRKAVDYWRQHKDVEDLQDMLIVAKGEGMYSEQIPSEWYMRKTHSQALRTAAEQGNSEAQFTLGIENDLQGNDRRMDWYEKAAKQGHPKAAERLAALKNEKAENAKKEQERREQLAKEDAARRAKDLALKKNCVGKQIVWRSEVTYDFGKGGLAQGLGDLIGLGALHQEKYTIEYTAIVEKVIGDESVKCIIKRVEIIDPGFASSNYLKYRKYVNAEVREELGETRVLDMDEFSLK